MFKSIKKFCGKQAETPLWVLLFLFVAIVVLNAMTVRNINSTEDSYQAAIATYQEAIARLNDSNPVPECGSDVPETVEAQESLSEEDQAATVEAQESLSEEDQAASVFWQALASGPPLANLYSGLGELGWCVNDNHLHCGWSAGERDSVHQNLSSIDGDDFLQEVIATRERVWNLREERGGVKDMALAMRNDKTDAGKLAKFARLKEQGSDLISLPYEAILDSVEAVGSQAGQLGFEENRLDGLTRLAETARIEITELIRRLDNLH